MIIQNAYLFVYSNKEDDYVHDVRKRTINAKLFNEITSASETQHKQYKEEEGRLLKQ